MLVTCDRWRAMKHGPALSNTLNLIKTHPLGQWRQLVNKPTHYEVGLDVAGQPQDRLSEAYETVNRLAQAPISTARTLTYRSPEKTLETAEVDAAHQRILAALEKALPATVRR